MRAGFSLITRATPSPVQQAGGDHRLGATTDGAVCRAKHSRPGLPRTRSTSPPACGAVGGHTVDDTIGQRGAGPASEACAVAVHPG